MVVGTTLAAITILNGFAPELPFGSANVLYTFYPPLQAHPAFYVGAALLIVGSWIVGADYFLTYRAWRADNPDERIPPRRSWCSRRSSCGISPRPAWPSKSSRS